MFITSFLTSKGHETFDQEEISAHYRSQYRFWIDCISLLGSDVFSGISSNMSVFGMFKCMRVFRMGSMIRRSVVGSETKTFLNLTKLCFYLFVYIHILACYFWIAIENSLGTKYYKDFASNIYKSQDGVILKDEFGTNLPAEPDIYLKFGPHPTFADTDWNRYKEDERSDWFEENQKWDNRKRIWIMTIEWVNYPA